ncbi:MAG: hypothetical protein QW222_05635 [Candidatus Bathyarchaeia archaeon]
MAKGHYKLDSEDLERFWRKVQEHFRFTDEDMEHFKNNPGKVKAGLRMASPDVQSKLQVLEVVESHGCLAGMRPGDKLYYRAGTLFETKMSDNCCAFALSYLSSQLALGAQTLILKDIDPNEIYVKFLSCAGASPKYGGSCGNVIFKIYTIEEGKTGGT